MSRDDLAKKIDQWITEKHETQIIQFNEVNDFIRQLNDITGKGMPDDPYISMPDTLFRIFSTNLGKIHKQYGIFSLKRYYEKCLGIEIDNNERLHKADILYFIGRYYLDLKNYKEAFYYWILSFLEDILSEFYKTNPDIENSLKLPVYEWIQLEFDIPNINLIELRKNALALLQSEIDKILSPEVLKFKLRNAGHQPPKLIDYQSYHPNIPYRESLYKKITDTNDDKLWEQFVAFLLSSIDGFEPISDVRPGDKSYQFDAIVRNYASHELFVSSLGDYIGVECKFFDKTTTVNVEMVNHFAAKLNFHDMRTGILFSNKPISGWEKVGAQYGKLVLTKIYNRNGIVIFIIDANDIFGILEGRNLIEILTEKYEQVRLCL